MIVVFLCSVECAELAVNVADVGVVDVTVDDVGHHGVPCSVVGIPLQLVSSRRCERPQFRHGQAVKREGILLRDALAAHDAFCCGAGFGRGSGLHAG